MDAQMSVRKDTDISKNIHRIIAAWVVTEKKAAVNGETSEQQLSFLNANSCKKIVQEMGLEPTRS